MFVFVSLQNPLTKLKASSPPEPAICVAERKSISSVVPRGLAMLNIKNQALALWEATPKALFIVTYPKGRLSSPKLWRTRRHLLTKRQGDRPALSEATVTVYTKAITTSFCCYSSSPEVLSSVGQTATTIRKGVKHSLLSFLVVVVLKAGVFINTLRAFVGTVGRVRTLQEAIVAQDVDGRSGLT